MNYLDELFQKKQEYSVAANIQTFKNEYYHNKKTLHLFVEDEDDYEFYHAFASRIYNDYEIYRYAQKGKAKLFEAYREMAFDKYKPGRVLFFYDKDYDDLIQKTQPVGSNLFMTSHYSIENYFVNEEAYRIILTYAYRYTPPELIEQVISEIRPLYEIFCSKLKIVTSWILIYREDSSFCDLDEIKFDDLFMQEKDVFTCTKKVLQTKYAQLMADTTIVNQHKKQYRTQGLKVILESKSKADPSKFSYKAFLRNYRKINSIQDRKKYLRGKYEIWFLFKVFVGNFSVKMKAYNEKAGNYNAKDENKEKIPRIAQRMQINESTIFSLVTPKMKIPSDLDQFLRNNLATA